MRIYSHWSVLSSLYFATQLMFFVQFSSCGKVLVVPIEGSHWVNMNILISAIHSRGHSVTVLRSEKSWYIKEKSPNYSSITVPDAGGVDEKFIKAAIMATIDIERGKSSVLNFLNLQLMIFDKMSEAHRMVSNMAGNVLGDQNLLKTLKEGQYDMVITDPAWAAGVLLAHYLQLPLVFNVRWITSGEGHLAIAPSPLSHIPMTGTGFSDKMNFVQRIKNVLLYGLTAFQDRFFIRPHYQAVCDKYFQQKVDFYEMIQAADLWLMRVDFVFEFPRPTMPNVIYMGGFQCTPSKPLPQDLEDFMQSSGEHGVIVMSLGTFVSELPSDIADEIAAAFSQLPQKVIWRYTGNRPAGLSNNTRLVSWMPQNDLLGHPKTRAFVAHGGTNGVQEAMYHGVPVVGLPIFFDQYDNLLRLKERGGAEILTIGSIDRKIFLQAVQDVLHDPSYRMNMQRLSGLHRDQPMKPLDHALFWIEFVMRHKGVAHLRTESYKMPWYVYHSVDVVAVLLAAVLIFMLFTATLVKCLCVRICCKRKTKHD